MIKQTKSTPWDIANIMRGSYQTSQIIDAMATMVIAQLVEPNKSFETISELNRIVRTIFSGFTIDNIDQQTFDKLKSLDMAEENIQSVIQMLNPYLKGGYDFAPNSVFDLAKLVKINELGKVADFNCNTSALLREVIKQNKFKGEVHLFSNNISSLKLSLVNIFPYNKNIVLHLTDFKGLRNCDEHFDFIYALPPFGYKQKGEEPLEIFENEARRMLKQDGKMLLVVPAGFLFQLNNKYRNIRRKILDTYAIDAIISLSNVFKPYTGIETALILLDKSKPLNQKVFVAHLNFIDKTFEDIKIVIDAYFQHIKGKTIENVSPITNRVDKQELQEDFNIKRFDPKQIRLNDKISKKYKIVFLDEVCEILPGEPYGTKDYTDQSNNSIPYIRIQDIKNGVIDLSVAKHVNPKPKQGSLTRKGDLLLSISGTIGKTAIVNKSSENKLITSGMVIVRPNENKIVSEFLNLGFSSQFVLSQLQSETTGATISHLSLTYLRKIKIPILPLSEQRRIVAKIEELKQELNDIQSKESKIKSDLKSIIDGAFD